MSDGGREAARKLIHLVASLGAALVVWMVEPVVAAAVLAGATMVALLVELGRLLSDRFGRTFRGRLGPLLRPTESAGLTGATSLAAGYTVAATLFPGLPALAAILVTGVADAAAAVAGRRWGRHRIPGGKSIEGSAVMLLATLGLLLLLAIEPLPAVVIAVVVTLVEAATLRVDDNLYLPVVVAALVRGIGVAAG